MGIKYILPRVDVHRVLLAATELDRIYLETILDTVARISEINRLRWNTDVFLDRADNSYVILKTRKKRHGDFKSRKHHMNKRMYKNFLHLYNRMVDDQVYVFENERRFGNDRFVHASQKEHAPYRYRSKLLKGLCKKAAVRPFGYHALRRYGASLLADQNVPLSVIQEILGHEDIRTTQIYIQTIKESVKTALELLCEGQFEEANSEERRAVSGEIPHKIPHKKGSGQNKIDLTL